MSEATKIEIKRPASLNEADFESLRQLIFELSGINLQNHKKELVRARLFTRLQKLGLKSFRQYYHHLTSDDDRGEEKVQLLNAISTNKTEFFREKAHFDFLKKKAFPALEKEPVIRILCAACSTGEEAYTLGMTAFEYFDYQANTKVSIQACDINTNVLEKAERGIYPNELVRTLPKETLHRFFLQGTGELSGFVKVNPELQRMISFHRYNLMERLPYEKPFHIIFCRNVVIYFSRETQEGLFRRLHHALVPKGFLILGHSESMAFFNLPVKYIQPSVYQKEV